MSHIRKVSGRAHQLVAISKRLKKRIAARRQLRGCVLQRVINDQRVLVTASEADLGQGAGATSSPQLWLLVCNAKRDALLPDDLLESVEHHGCHGYIWICATPRRATLQRRVQRLVMLCAPCHARYLAVRI